MKIISIVWYKVLPSKFGGQKGIACFNNELAKHHPLVCLCAANNEPADDLLYKVRPELPISKWQFILPSCWKKITDIVSQEKATHIILEHPYHGLAAIRARKTTGAKLVVHSHNIEAERFRKMGKWWWRLLFHYEKWVYHKANFVLFKTEADRLFAMERFKIDKHKCTVIPYGITKPVEHQGAPEYIRKKHSIPTDHFILLFAGTLDYKPNAKAVEAIYKYIAPDLEATGTKFKIIICGRNNNPSFSYLNELSHPAIIKAGEVEDIGLYFAGACVFINPVQYGGGIQIKNLDALSYGLNIVAFKKMVDDKLKQVCSEKLFLSEDKDSTSFICQILMALKEKKETPSAFFDRYNWRSSITGFLENLNRPDVLNKV